MSKVDIYSHPIRCEHHSGPEHVAETVRSGVKFDHVAVRCDSCDRIRGIRMVRN